MLTVRVRPAEVSDIAAIVEIHRDAFEGYFLTSLGTPFLRRFYLQFLQSGDACLRVACGANGNVGGFLAGVYRPDLFFSAMRRRHGVALFCSSLPGIVRQPRVAFERLVAAVRYRGDASPSFPGYWLLSSLAVAGTSTGQGMGGALVREFCLEGISAGAPGVYLMTDLMENDGVLDFYAKCGFERRSSQVRANGRRMVTLVKGLGP